MRLPEATQEVIQAEAARVVQAIRGYSEALRSLDHRIKGDPVRVDLTVTILREQLPEPFDRFSYITPGVHHAPDDPS